MDSSKTKTIIDFIIKLLSVISGFIGKKSANGISVTDLKQDENTNKNELKRVNDVIRGKLK